MTKKAELSVDDFIRNFNHPQVELIQEIRTRIKNVNGAIAERIKWNAPCYHIDEIDFVTFAPLSRPEVMLVFHHPSIVVCQNEFLEGKYKDRRLMYFKESTNRKYQLDELVKVIQFSLQEIEKQLLKNSH